MMPIGAAFLDEPKYQDYINRQRYKVSQREAELRGPKATYLHPAAV
jgi:hypothetical protein